MEIILPKDRIDLTPHQRKTLYFTVGPVLGGGDWQHNMCDALCNLDPTCIVAVPTRWDLFHPLHKLQMHGPKLEQFDRQLPYERCYITAAAQTHPRGCVVCWLGSQKEPRQDGRGYAEDTRGEIGELRGRMMHDKYMRVVVGADKDFTGLDVIQRNFNLALGYEFPIYESIQETAQAAFNMSQ